MLFAALMLASSDISAAEIQDSLAFPEEIMRERKINSTKISVIGSDRNPEVTVDSIKRVVERFYVDQFRHFQDPMAPAFMFMTKDADLAFGVGGQVRLRGMYDWHNSIQANGFSPYLIPIPIDPAHRRRISGTPAGSGLFFTLLGRNSLLGSFQAYIETNFDGYQHKGLKLKKAWFKFRKWTIGQANSTFDDGSATPPTIDGAGPNGETSNTTLLVRWLKEWHTGWSFAGSVEFPSSNIKDDGVYTEKCDDWLPDFAAFGQFEWDRGQSHVRLSAIARTLTYRDITLARTHSILGWGAQLSGMVKIGRPATIYFAACAGQGIGTYTADLSCDNLDLLPTPGSDGMKLYAPTSLGLTLGAQYYILPELFVSMNVSEMRLFSRSGAPATDYKYGLYGAVNCFYNITPRLQTGLEYLIGSRHDIGGASASADRLTALFQFSF